MINFEKTEIDVWSDNKTVKRLYPWLICILPVMIAIYCCIIKSGLYVDEYYSYGFANSSKGFSLIQVFDGNLVNRVITQNDLRDYIIAEPEETFTYGYILDNCAQDMTPPLYYCILHTICSFFPGEFSKWFGLCINLFAFLIILLGLYHISLLMFESRWVATLVMFCYGFSRGGLNCVTYIRMYAILAMLSVLLTYFVVRYIALDRKRDCVICGVLIYLGFLTQYNFAFYAFFLCGAACLALLYKRKLKSVVLFAACALIGVIAFFLTWPEFFSQLVKDTGVKNDARIAGNPILFIKLFMTYGFYEAGTELCILGIVIGLIIVLWLVSLGRKHKKNNRIWKKMSFKMAYLVVVFGFFVGTMGIIYYSPFLSPRYCYITLPCFSLLMGGPFWVLKQCWSEFFEEMKIKLSINLAGILVLIGALVGAMRFDEMTYLYLGNPETLEVTEAVKDCPCLFFNTNYAKSITAALEHLCMFEDFFVTDGMQMDECYAYLKNHENSGAMVVFVDNDPVVSSGLDEYAVISSLMAIGIYDSVVELYELDSTCTFLLYNRGDHNE